MSLWHSDFLPTFWYNSRDQGFSRTTSPSVRLRLAAWHDPRFTNNWHARSKTHGWGLTKSGLGGKRERKDVLESRHPGIHMCTIYNDCGYRHFPSPRGDQCPPLSHCMTDNREPTAKIPHAASNLQMVNVHQLL